MDVLIGWLAMWINPSRARPQKAEKCIRSMIDCGSTALGILVIAEDDPCLNEYLAIDLPLRWRLDIGPAGTWFTDKMNYGFKKYPNEPWYGSIADDTYAKTMDFEQRLIECAGKWHVASANDGWQAKADINVGRMHGAGIYGGEFLRALGYWYPAGFKHQFAEDVHETICRRLKNWKMLMDVLTIHDHPFKTGAPMDDTSKQVNTAELFQEGKHRFAEWLANEADDDINRIRMAMAQAGV